MYSYGKNVVVSFASKISQSLTPRQKRKRSHDEMEEVDSGSKRPATDSKEDTKVNEQPTSSSSRSSGTCSASSTDSPASCDKQNQRKKRHRLDRHKTPRLVHPLSSDSDASVSEHDTLSSSRPNKRKKVAGVMGQRKSLLLEMIPHDVLETHIFSFLTEARDFYSLQLTCREIKTLSSKMDILRDVDLSGDSESGKGSILNNVDSSDVAIERLYKFAAAGNQQALYMYVYSSVQFV